LEIIKKTEATRDNLHNDAFDCLFNSNSACYEKDSMQDQDLDYQPPFDPSVGEEQ
jgi:hypothetical protein